MKNYATRHAGDSPMQRQLFTNRVACSDCGKLFFANEVGLFDHMVAHAISSPLPLYKLPANLHTKR